MLWYALSVVLIVLRVHGITHPAFQAISHIFVGVLLASGVLSQRDRRWLFWVLLVSLTLVETLCTLKVL